ncbi:DUF1566 domain-containing protein [bacterium]|nr:DUF1566 domain-containing protein [bacterium]
MKKLQMLAVLILSLLFVLSCVSDDDDEDQTDTYSGSDTTDTATDTLPGDQTDSDYSDTGHDPADSQSDNDSDTQAPDNDTQPAPDNDTQPAPDNDTTPAPDNDSQPAADDDTESAPDEDVELTEEEKCTAAGGTWNENETESTCTKTANCAEIPENSEPNGETSYTQTYTDGTWSDEIPVEYNSEEAGVCRFKCTVGHFWHDSACIADPCSAETDPCDKENTTPGSCSPIDETTFTCGCIEEYHWENNECTSNSRTEVACTGLPEKAHWNIEDLEGETTTPVIDQTWNDETQLWEPSEKGENGTQTEGCYFSCNENYGWAVAGEIGKCLQECSLTSETPCKDSANGRIWSARPTYYKTWSEAKEYCENLEEGGYPQGTWQLPTINDLRTIIVRCTYNMPGGDCEVTDECTTSSCYNNLVCNNTNHKECKTDNNSNDSCGSHSKLCETNTLWSTSKNGSNAWIVKFSEGNIGYSSTDNNTTHPVRCVIRYNLNENEGEDSGNQDD